jgi:hypothetical protein
MGVGVSALGNGKDQDEKLLDEKMIEEVGLLVGWVVVGAKFTSFIPSPPISLTTSG